MEELDSAASGRRGGRAAAVDGAGGGATCLSACRQDVAETNCYKGCLFWWHSRSLVFLGSTFFVVILGTLLASLYFEFSFTSSLLFAISTANTSGLVQPRSGDAEHLLTALYDVLVVPVYAALVAHASFLLVGPYSRRLAREELEVQHLERVAKRREELLQEVESSGADAGGVARS